MRYTCNKKASPCFVGAVENNRIIPDACAPLVQNVAAPILAKHDYRNVKIAENTVVTIDLENVKSQLKKSFYGSTFDMIGR